MKIANKGEKRRTAGTWLRKVRRGMSIDDGEGIGNWEGWGRVVVMAGTRYEKKGDARTLLIHRGERRKERWGCEKHGQHWRTSKLSMETSIVVVGRQLQTKMRLCDPLGSPATWVVSLSFPVASAREAPPRED